MADIPNTHQIRIDRLIAYDDVIIDGVNKHSAPHKVYLMGDSLTGISGNYGTTLQALLGSDWQVIWKGIPGQGTAQMLARFDTDVIASGDAEYVVIWGGVNDIASGRTAAQIAVDLQSMYDAAHNAGIKVINVTVTPFDGAGAWVNNTTRNERLLLNSWLLTPNSSVNYSIDTYNPMDDPSATGALLPSYDSGDHLHFSSTGYARAGNLIYAGAAWTPMLGTSLIAAGDARVDRLGVGVNAKSTFDLLGGAAIGSYAGTKDAPGNGIIVSGNSGFGTSSPKSKVEVVGNAGVTSFTGLSKLGLSISGASSTDDYSGIDFYDSYRFPDTPRARIAASFGASGSKLVMGTSNNYSTGVTNEALVIGPDGKVFVGTTDIEGSINALNAGQAAGMVGFVDKATMDAYLVHDANTVALVTNDATPANNGSYIKLGASGAGSWQRSSYDRVALVENSVGVINSELSPILPVFVQLKNLFNPDDLGVIIGGYIGSTGDLVSNALFNTTGFIPVTEGLHYTARDQDVFVTWYNASKAFIGYSEAFYATGYVVAPTGAHYGRFIGYASAWATFQVEQGDVTTSFVPYRVKVDYTYIPEVIALQEKMTSIEGAFLLSKNLFDPNSPDILIGSYLGGNGLPVANAEYNTTGFIPVTEGLHYTTPVQNVLALWYDSSRTFLGYSVYADGYVTAHSGSSYGRFIGEAYRWATFQVEQADAPTGFVPYNTTIDYHYIPEVVGTKTETNLLMSAFIQSKNLCNPNDEDILIGSYISAGNTVVANTLFNTTGFILVTAGLNYTATDQDVVVSWYNSGKGWIGYSDPGDFTADGYVTAPTGAAYGRFVGRASTWSTFQVEQASVATAYLPYDRIILKNANIPAAGGSTLTGKKFTSFGDSITAQATWQGYVADALGLTHTNCGISATALAGAVNAERPCFWEPSRINAVEAADPDILTILGGANDLYASVTIGTDAQYDLALGSKDKTTFKGAYSFIIETLLTWKQALKIVILTTTYGHSESTVEGLTYRDFAQASREVANYYGLPVVDLRREMGLNKLSKTILLADEIHPNATGGKVIASLVLDVFKKISGF
jgi:lysophospholipase L1-like esterase